MVTAALAAASEPSGLGQPLPAGALRVYEPGPTGSLQYIGAATLSDTPKDAKVDVTLTNVFDIYALAKVLESKRVDKRRTSYTVEIVVHNEKGVVTQVRLAQGFSGTWKIVSESDKHGKLNANLAQWTLSVPAGGEVKLKFTVVLG